MKFKYTTRAGRRWVSAELDGAVVGRLTWNATGRATSVFVEPSHRRQGIGGQLWSFANSDAVPLAERPAFPTDAQKRSDLAESLYQNELEKQKGAKPEVESPS